MGEGSASVPPPERVLALQGVGYPTNRGLGLGRLRIRPPLRNIPGIDVPDRVQGCMYFFFFFFFLYPLKNVSYVENLTVRLFVQWLEPFFFLNTIRERVQQGKDGTNLKSDL